MELQEKLQNTALIDCFSQEKDSLIMSFNSNSGEIHLEFSTHFPGIFLLFRDHFSRARKNTISFQTIPAGMAFRGIRMHHSDRILVLDFEDNYAITLFIRGAKTNALFVSGTEAIPFRKSDEKIVSELKHLLQNPQKQEEFSDLDQISFIDQLAPDDPRLGKEIKNELSVRINESGDPESELRKIISGILHGGFRLANTSSGYAIVPEAFLSANPEDPLFETAVDAVSGLVKRRFAEARFHQKKNQLIKEYTRQIKSLSKIADDLLNRLKLGDRSALYEKYAQVLLMTPDKKEKGLKEVFLRDYMNPGELLKIPLDDKLDINQNTKRYFEKAKEEKTSYAEGILRLPEIKAKISKFTTDLKLIEQCKSLRELSPFEKNEAENKKSKTADDTVKFRAFQIEPHYIVYVGKDSRQNDELTLHFAKPNDIWMHARGCPGSHTVLRDTSGRNIFGKDVIKAAASIAAYFSKARNAKYVPVAYTEKKNVVKRKGMEAGKVQMMRESIVMAEPALPKNEIQNKGDQQ
ncbi:MAG: hypothetical protein FMNOHCHN_02893 [Ignavibacteriaceae bacterium]|nr:hypothetical protein [Ignavibacteriaceae bacterium]